MTNYVLFALCLSLVYAVRKKLLCKKIILKEGQNSGLLLNYVAVFPQPVWRFSPRGLLKVAVTIFWADKWPINYSAANHGLDSMRVELCLAWWKNDIQEIESYCNDGNKYVYRLKLRYLSDECDENKELHCELKRIGRVKPAVHTKTITAEV